MSSPGRHSATSDEQRCPVTKFDVRCQLLLHDDAHPHVAMSRRPGRPIGYVTWTASGLGQSSWNLESGPELWAASFPRVE